MEEKETKQVKVKKTGGLNWWLISGGVICFAFTVLMAMLYTQDMGNFIIAMGFIVFCGISALLFYMAFKKRESGLKFVTDKTAKYTGNENCFTFNHVYNEKRKKCDPTTLEVEEIIPPADWHPQYHERLGKWMYWRYYDPIENEYYPGYLPEPMNYSPEEYARLLKMSNCTKLLKPRPKPGEIVKPLFLLIGIGLVLFGFLITTPPPGG